MKQTICLKDIKVQDVGVECILLVAKFSRALKNKHGNVVHLQDKHILNTVAAYARSTDSAELISLYKEIEDEVLRYLRGGIAQQDTEVLFEHQGQPLELNRLDSEDQNQT